MGGSGRVEWKMFPSLPLLSCELPVSVKENPNRKKRIETHVSSFLHEITAAWFFLESQQSFKLPEKFFLVERGEGGKVNLVLGFLDQNYLS